MRTDPDLIEIATGERGMIAGIRACIESQCLISAIVLIYAFIDSLSALTRPTGRDDTSPKEFKDWVNEYLLPDSNLSCTADELYGARCGVLHTQSPESRLQRHDSETVQRLIYYWKSGPAADAEKPLPTNAKTIVVEDLFHGFEQAVNAFLNAIEQENDLADRVEKNRAELLCYRPFEVVTIQVAAP